jgi:competence transcription factor ComK
MTKKSNNKIIVRFINNDTIIKEMKYNSLTAVSKDLKIDYFHLYAVYQYSMKLKVRKMQPYILKLSQQLQIIDNPEYYNINLQIEPPLEA